MYALYANREGMTNIFIRLFPNLDMMDSATIEMGSGPDHIGSVTYHSFPEAYEPFALNLETGELLWFADEWEAAGEDLRQAFFCSFSCFDPHYAI